MPFSDNVKFTQPRQIQTRFGRKYMRHWQLPSDPIIAQGFWKFWKENKTSMMGRGFSIYKTEKTGKWRLQEWHDQLSDFQEHEEKEEIVLTSSLDPTPLKDVSGLREWQVPTAASLAESIKLHGAAIDGSDTGTGKTYSACAAARQLGLNLGVVCPKVVVETWRRVIEDHFGLEAVFVMNYEALRGGKHKDIVIKERINNSSIIEEFKWTAPKDALIIFDESHRLKGQNTLNSQLATTAKEQGYKLLCCSATNAVNPLELNAVGKVLGLHKGGRDFYKFMREHDCAKGRFTWEFGGSKYAMKKLHRDMFLNKGARIRKDDIPNFPESEIVAESYSLDDKSSTEIDRIYFEMNKELSDLAKKVKKDKNAIQLTIRLRARQKIELMKAPLFIEMAEDLLEDGHSVVILCNFNDTIKAISKKLKTECIIWGANKGKERQQFMDDFQADKERIILVNIQAGGIGISLQDLHGNHPRVALISPNDSAVLLRQALGRVHRDGALTKSMQKILFVANTVEEDVCNNVKMKLKNLDLINDGDLDPSKDGMLQE